MTKPELPNDPPIDIDTPVDWDAVEEAMYEAGCKKHHRHEEDELITRNHLPGE